MSFRSNTTLKGSAQHHILCDAESAQHHILCDAERDLLAIAKFLVIGSRNVALHENPQQKCFVNLKRL